MKMFRSKKQELQRHKEYRVVEPPEKFVLRRDAENAYLAHSCFA